MIKKFKQYNEGLRDEMKPKSDEDVKIGVIKFIKEMEEELKERIEDGDSMYEDEVYNTLNLIQSIHKEDAGGLVKLLIDKKLINANSLINEYVEDIMNEDGGIADMKELIKILKELND